MIISNTCMPALSSSPSMPTKEKNKNLNCILHLALEAVSLSIYLKNWRIWKRRFTNNGKIVWVCVSWKLFHKEFLWYKMNCSYSIIMNWVKVKTEKVWFRALLILTFVSVFHFRSSSIIFSFNFASRPRHLSLCFQNEPESNLLSWTGKYKLKVSFTHDTQLSHYVHQHFIFNIFIIIINWCVQFGSLFSGLFIYVWEVFFFLLFSLLFPASFSLFICLFPTILHTFRANELLHCNY